jgi:hypothetical protein
MNKRAIGNAFQDAVCKWLSKDFPGITIHNFKSSMRFLPHLGRWVSPKANDLWGCVDIACIGPDECTNKPLFIQCTTGKGIAQKEKDMLSVPWCLEHMTVEVWQRAESRRWVIRRLVKRDGVKVFVKYAEIRSGKYIKTEEDE